MTSLAVIPSKSHPLVALGEASERFYDNPPDEMHTISIAGFAVVDRTQARPSWASHSNSFRSDAAELKRRLAHHDVRPMATIPLAFWKRIIEEVGLYDLKPTNEGQVKVYPKAVAAAANEIAAPTLANIALALAAVAASGALAWLLHGLGTTFWADLPGRDVLPNLVAVAAFGIAVGVATFMALWAIARLAFWLTGGSARGVDARLRARHYVRRHGAKAVMQALMDPSAHKDPGTGQLIDIRLPVPPQPVVDTLMKLRGYGGLRVAVEEGAVQFERSPQEIVVQGIRRQWDEERREREEQARKAREIALAADPIIYVTHGSAVAIVAQFGDCPIEQAVIDRVVSLASFNNL